ncbi:MAG TPA: FAD-binding oxidoreductase [bacterium]|nr:FAD-binding oxidoreductase [bacterium]
MPDVVIVGAGIFGAATACFLAERGVRPLVLERASVAGGATGWTSGIIRVHYTNPHEARLALFSRTYFREWAGRIGGSAGFQETGFLRIVGVHDRERLLANVAMLRAIGTRVEVLEPEELRRLQPAFAVDDVGAAAYEPEGGFAVGTDATAALAARAVRLGAEVRQGVGAWRLRIERGRVTGVEAGGGVIAAGQVVVAAGAWSMELLSRAGITVPVRTKLIRAGLAQHAAGAAIEHMTVYDDAVGTFFRPERRGRTEFGLRYEWDVAPAHTSPPVALELLADGSRQLARRIPAIGDAGLARGWGAPDGFSPDGASIFGSVPGVEGLYVAIAGSGTGFKIGPAAGIGMAELLTTGRFATADLSAFRLTRFDEGALLQGPTDYRRPRWRDEPLP